MIQPTPSPSYGDGTYTLVLAGHGPLVGLSMGLWPVDDIPEPAQEGAVEVTYETLGDLVQRFHDHTEAIPVHRIQVIEGVQREQGHRIVRVESTVTTLTKRIAELERDNRRLRGTTSVESQRVNRLQRGMSRMQRELRQIRRLRFYDRVIVGRFEACARKHMGYRP
ncbi:hypothetical protein Tco_1314384 [Tanacetum coccineum]